MTTLITTDFKIMHIGGYDENSEGAVVVYWCSDSRHIDVESESYTAVLPRNVLIVSEDYFYIKSIYDFVNSFVSTMVVDLFKIEDFKSKVINYGDSYQLTSVLIYGIMEKHNILVSVMPEFDGNAKTTKLILKASAVSNITTETKTGYIFKNKDGLYISNVEVDKSQQVYMCIDCDGNKKYMYKSLTSNFKNACIFNRSVDEIIDPKSGNLGMEKINMKLETKYTETKYM